MTDLTYSENITNKLDKKYKFPYQQSFGKGY